MRSQPSNRLYILGAFALILLILQIVAILPSGSISGDGQNTVLGGNDSYLSENTTQPTTTTTTAPPEPVVVPMLVNKQNVMSADFMPVNLVNIGDEVKGTSTLQLNATVLQAYKVMYADIQKADVTVPSIISGYRSYARQKELYDKKVAQYGEGQKVTAAPGTSEHQYSACIDISTDGTCQNDFGELDIGKWIDQNSYKYGFVIRYPSGKKELTGINTEPWHIRYVGVEHATKMHELNMCLEEYVPYLRSTYDNVVDETSPDQYPAPAFAGDMGPKRTLQQ